MLALDVYSSPAYDQQDVITDHLAICPATFTRSQSIQFAINSIQCKWYQYSIIYPSALPLVLAAVYHTRVHTHRLFTSQLLLDIRLEVLRLLSARPPALDLSILANQELLKVPLDTLEAHEARLLVLEPFEGGVCGGAVDLS